MAFETNNLVYGRTNNPFDVTRTPGGSSGGAAAIVAAGGSPLDIGSDTGGSIRVPAHFCGIAGLRSTSGTISEEGMWPPTVGRIVDIEALGPIVRRVEDAALVLAVLRGEPPRAPDPSALRGRRVAAALDVGRPHRRRRRGARRRRPRGPCAGGGRHAPR